MDYLRKPFTILPNQHDMVRTCAQARKSRIESVCRFVITCTSDIPIVSSEMFDWIVEQAQSRATSLLDNDRRNSVEVTPWLETPDGPLQDISAARISPSSNRALFCRTKLPISKRMRNRPRQLMFVGFDTLLLIRLHRADLAGFTRRLKNTVSIGSLSAPFRRSRWTVFGGAWLHLPVEKQFSE
jgi:hypothetical protein